jgi:hypothetical protein
MYGTYTYSNGSKVLGIIVPFFLTVSLVCVCIGIGLPYWIMLGETKYGLFQICNSTMFTQCVASLTYLSDNINNRKFYYYSFAGVTVMVLKRGSNSQH